MKFPNIFIAGLFMLATLNVVVAQTTGPDIKAGSQSESTAVKDGAASNPSQPGATGSTMVPGSNSTVTGDSRGTNEQKAGETAVGGAK